MPCCVKDQPIILCFKQSGEKQFDKPTKETVKIIRCSFSYQYPNAGYPSKSVETPELQGFIGDTFCIYPFTLLYGVPGLKGLSVGRWLWNDIDAESGDRYEWCTYGYIALSVQIGNSRPKSIRLSGTVHSYDIEYRKTLFGIVNLSKRESEEAMPLYQPYGVKQERAKQQFYSGMISNMANSYASQTMSKSVSSVDNEKSAAGSMVKGAIVGNIIAGPAGAVVGAMIAKESHDHKSKD